ncbi:MAG: glycosyltransferase family 1 protein [Chitinophagaceae bacterium]
MIKNQDTSAWHILKNRDLICFSHLRWSFVYQRPQHLLNRFSNYTRVFFIEEPIFHDAPDKLKITKDGDNVFVVVPYLQNGHPENEIISRQKQIVNKLFLTMNIHRYFCWYYTPMALPFSEHLQPDFIVYDCMDELSAFKFAPQELKTRERQLLQMADVVFTGGYSIYAAKKNSHRNIYPFPSSIDKEHFASAREIVSDPEDQATISHPRFGFYGVIDERLDIDMIAEVSKAKPEWNFVMIGPVVKIDTASLPCLPNIHYLGGKTYDELPRYLAGWDVAIIPFAMNESTKFISPTKTPEYLAAGKPVISAPIKDVVSPYADNKLVYIAANAKEFIKHGTTLLKVKNKKIWLTKVDAFLAGNSWDRTWSQMVKHIEKITESTRIVQPKSKEQIYV